METKESQKQAWDDEDVIDVGEILYALLRKLWIDWRSNWRGI